MCLRGSIFFFSVFCFFVSRVFAQGVSHDHGHVHGEGEQCGFDSWYSSWVKDNPSAARRFQETMNRAVLAKRKRDKRFRDRLGPAYDISQEPVYTLPIVVHVLHREGDAVGKDTNVAKEYLEKMIEELNAYFSATQPDRVVPPEFQGVDGGDMGIRFALARQDPDGLPTDGIIRLPMPAGTGFLSGFNEQTARISPQWDVRRYINAWIVPAENLSVGPLTVFGIAHFPSSPHVDGLGRGLVNTHSTGVDEIDGLQGGDGVIVIHTAVGGGSPFAYTERPRTLAHEIGHYLGLFHPWSGGNLGFAPLTACDIDDGCVDTPRTREPSSLEPGDPCTALPNCFKGTDTQYPMTQNYMDYSPNRCQHVFTLCQRERMRTVLESTSFRRTLWDGNDALTPVDPALTQKVNNVGFTSFDRNYFNCSPQVAFQNIEIANYGANSIESIRVQFFIGDTPHGAVREIAFSPALASTSRMTLFEEGDAVNIPIPDDMYDGALSLRILNVNGAEDTDEDYGRNTYTITVSRGRVENKLHALEFEVNEDGEEDVNWRALRSYENAFSIATGSNGNKLLRIHRTDAPEDGHQAALLLSPFMSVGEIVNEGGGAYALGVRLRYSYVANDFSEGDRLQIALFDCEGATISLYSATDVDASTSHYPQGGELPHDRTFRELHLPLPISSNDRIATYNTVDPERMLGDLVQLAVTVTNGGGVATSLWRSLRSPAPLSRIYLVWISVFLRNSMILMCVRTMGLYLR